MASIPSAMEMAAVRIIGCYDEIGNFAGRVSRVLPGRPDKSGANARIIASLLRR